MKRHIRILTSIALAFVMCCACTNEEKETSTATLEEAPKIEDIKIPSRDTEISATVTLPANQKNVPFVVLCHGHGGSRSENEGFDTISNALADKGIASIRVDYPGCGESIESFTQNNLTNMIADTESAINYMMDKYPVNNKIGIFGYSMGGRIALQMLAEKKYDFSSVCLLAPAADTEDLKELFGGKDNWEQLKQTAQESKDQYADFTTIYGQQQKLSVKWFDDLEGMDVDTLLTEVKKAYQGPSMVIYAVDDQAVSPSVSQQVATELNAQVIMTPEDGHGYGFYSDKEYVKRIVVENTADFFETSLN